MTVLARAASRLRLFLPWTRRGEMNRMIDLVAEHHRITRGQAFAMMYAHADPRERRLLAPYKPVA